MPVSQKQAIVVPALKKPSLDPYDLGNYRPISNLSFVSKLLERCVNAQLTTYLTENVLIPEEQSVTTYDSDHAERESIQHNNTTPLVCFLFRH